MANGSQVVSVLAHFGKGEKRTRECVWVGGGDRGSYFERILLNEICR